MHKSSMLRMKWFIDTYLDKTKKGNILDVGSYDVNGTYKELFEETAYSYQGLDMEKGPNVDVVPASTYEWAEITNDNYDVVISGQALEHIEFFWVTVAEIIRVTKKGGLICIIAPNGFDEHRYPVDCWRFFTDGMIALARYYNLEIIHAHTNAAPADADSEWYSENCADSMLVARKPYSGVARTIDLRNYKCIPANHKKLDQGMIGYREFQNKIQERIPENKSVEVSPEQESKPQKIREHSHIVNIARKIMTRLKNIAKRAVKQ